MNIKLFFYGMLFFSANLIFCAENVIPLHDQNVISQDVMLADLIDRYLTVHQDIPGFVEKYGNDALRLKDDAQAWSNLKPVIQEDQPLLGGSSQDNIVPRQEKSCCCCQGLLACLFPCTCY